MRFLGNISYETSMLYKYRLYIGNISNEMVQYFKSVFVKYWQYKNSPMLRQYFMTIFGKALSRYNNIGQYIWNTNNISIILFCYYVMLFHCYECPFLYSKILHNFMHIMTFPLYQKVRIHNCENRCEPFCSSIYRYNY